MDQAKILAIKFVKISSLNTHIITELEMLNI